MKFPQMNKQPSRTVTVPNLAGGTNYRDSVSSVLDNQLTDCKNMWYHGGMLKTRPGFKTSSELCVPLDGMYASDYNVPTTKVLDVYKTADGVSKRLVMHYTADEIASYIFFNWIGDNVYETVPSITVYYKMSNIFVIQSKDEIFAFICGEGNYDIYKFTEDESGWRILKPEEITAPEVYTHCMMEGELLNEGGTVIYRSSSLKATQVSGYNLIGDYYKAVYSTVNRNLLTSEITSVPMVYMLPQYTSLTGAEKNGKKIVAKIKYKNGNIVTHEIVLPSTVEKDYNNGDGLKMSVTPYWVIFEEKYDEEYDTRKLLTADDYVEDNLELLLPCPSSQENKDKVFSCTQSEWFGGASEGLAGGTRLFVGGNKNEKEKALLLWSGLNDPLYFSENCYAYVGNSNSGLTGFGKQSNMLVLFKNYETYYTYYAQNKEITATDLINQTVIDYDANSVFFPIVQINSSIGCDMPDTIQLCRNRLVWTNSDGRVYTLVSNSQYSERNIYLVSEMIHPALKNDPNLSTATACDWNGYYVLFCKEKVYLMNYDSYGYQYITSYTKNEDANLHIPWYVWELPSGHQATEYHSQNVFTIANRLCCFSTLSKNSQRIGKPMSAILFADESYYSDDMVGYNVETGDFNSVIPYIINCAATTKLFDFSAPNKRKNVTSVGMSLGNNDGVPISVSFISEDGSEDVALEITAPEAEHRAPSYIQSVILNPSLRSVVRVGIKLECDGFMSLDGMTVTYKMLGGAR